MLTTTINILGTISVLGILLCLYYWFWIKIRKTKNQIAPIKYKKMWKRLIIISLVCLGSLILDISLWFGLIYPTLNLN